MAKKGVTRRGRGAAASSGGPATLTMGSTDVDPSQKQMEGMEEERIPEIESLITSIATNRKKIGDLKEQNKELHKELGEELHEHGLTSYKCAGKVAQIIEGEESVEVKEAKASRKQ